MNSPGTRALDGRTCAGFGFTILSVGLLNFASQIVMRRELAPGEFGTVNTVLGVVAVAAAPIYAVALVPRHGILSSDEAERWSAQIPGLMRLTAVGLGAVSLVLLFVLLPLLSLPRFSLQIFAILAVEATLAARLSDSLCRATHRLRLFAGLVIAGAVMRLAMSALGAHFLPLAQSGLGAFVLAAAIAALPALRNYPLPPLRDGLALTRKLLRPLLATASVILAVVLFANAHRMVAQANFGTADPSRFGYVDLNRFDDYQTAGLLAWGALSAPLPLLFIFHIQRGRLPRTTRASLRWFWIYLGALLAGTVMLVAAAPAANLIFKGDAAAFLPSFAAPVFMLGLLQGIAFFAIASRRHPECFTLGGCSVVYTILLFLFGREPQLMTTCMFGGALISLTAVLLVGVVRYARSHP